MALGSSCPPRSESSLRSSMLECSSSTHQPSMGGAGGVCISSLPFNDTARAWVRNITDAVDMAEPVLTDERFSFKVRKSSHICHSDSGYHHHQPAAFVSLQTCTKIHNSSHTKPHDATPSSSPAGVECGTPAYRRPRRHRSSSSFTAAEPEPLSLIYPTVPSSWGQAQLQSAQPQSAQQLHHQQLLARSSLGNLPGSMPVAEETTLSKLVFTRTLKVHRQCGAFQHHSHDESPRLRDLDAEALSDQELLGQQQADADLEVQRSMPPLVATDGVGTDAFASAADDVAVHQLSVARRALAKAGQSCSSDEETADLAVLPSPGSASCDESTNSTCVDSKQDDMLAVQRSLGAVYEASDVAIQVLSLTADHADLFVQRSSGGVVTLPVALAASLLGDDMAVERSSPAMVTPSVAASVRNDVAGQTVSPSSERRSIVLGPAGPAVPATPPRNLTRLSLPTAVLTPSCPPSPTTRTSSTTAALRPPPSPSASSVIGGHSASRTKAPGILSSLSLGLRNRLSSLLVDTSEPSFEGASRRPATSVASKTSGTSTSDPGTSSTAKPPDGLRPSGWSWREVSTLGNAGLSDLRAACTSELDVGHEAGSAEALAAALPRTAATAEHVEMLGLRDLSPFTSHGSTGAALASALRANLLAGLGSNGGCVESEAAGGASGTSSRQSSGGLWRDLRVLHGGDSIRTPYASNEVVPVSSELMSPSSLRRSSGSGGVGGGSGAPSMFGRSAPSRPQQLSLPVRDDTLSPRPRSTGAVPSLPAASLAEARGHSSMPRSVKSPTHSKTTSLHTSPTSTCSRGAVALLPPQSSGQSILSRTSLSLSPHPPTPSSLLARSTSRSRVSMPELDGGCSGRHSRGRTSSQLLLEPTSAEAATIGSMLLDRFSPPTPAPCKLEAVPNPIWRHSSSELPSPAAKFASSHPRRSLVTAPPAGWMGDADWAPWHLRSSSSGSHAYAWEEPSAQASVMDHAACSCSSGTCLSADSLRVHHGVESGLAGMACISEVAGGTSMGCSTASSTADSATATSSCSHFGQGAWLAERAGGHSRDGVSPRHGASTGLAAELAERSASALE